jgi:hypothetical protein
MILIISKKYRIPKQHLGIDIMGNQAVSLRSFALLRSAVPVGRRQKKPPPSIPQYTRLHSGCQPRKRADLHCASSSSFSHALFLPSEGLLHPQYSPAEKAGKYPCMSPLVFSAVAPSHSHRGWRIRRIRLDNYFYFFIAIQGGVSQSFQLSHCFSG